MRKRWTCLLLAALLAFGSNCNSYAATVNDVKQQRTQTKQKLEEVNENITAIEKKRKEVQSQISNLNANLVETILTLEVLEADLQAKEEEIAQAQAKYEEYKALEERQYELMKYRIQYLYENSESNYLEMLLTSESISDFLNRVDFATYVYKSDDERRAEYEQTKIMVAEQKAVLEEEEAELEEVREAQEVYKKQLDSQIASARSKVQNFDSELANAKVKAKEYQNTIKKQNAEIEKLLKEEEERNRQQEIASVGKKPSSGNSASTGTGNSDTVTNTGNTTGNTTKPDTTQKPPAENVSGSGLGAQIASYAVQFVGNPYVPGGTSLTNGADCSGFTLAVHKHFGISIPRVSVDQARGGREVSISNVQPGDIIYYGHHVGIYIGNGKIVHASTQKTGIKISNYTYRTPITVRRYW